MKILLILHLIIISFFTLAQDNAEGLSKMERSNYLYKKTFYPGDASIDVKYYKLDLTPTYTPQYLTGRVTINLTPVQNINAFYLELNGAFTIDTFSINGAAASYTRSGTKLNISLDRTYLPQELISVYIVYKGVPPNTGFGSYNFGDHSGTPIIYTLSEPYGAPDWFPCKDTPSDKADSCDVWITCPNNYYAVSNGVLQEQIDKGDGTTLFKWKTKYPIAQYLIAFSLTNYTVFTNYFKYTDTDSMPVVHYVYPENFDYSKPMIDKTPWMLKVYSDAFGLYPFIKEKYGQAQFGWSGGMEHQTVSFIASFDEGLMVHEMAHQWFGDKITCRDWHNIWLNEGFATWCSAYYYGQTYGPSNYTSFINGCINSAKNAKGSIWVQDTTSVGSIFNSPRTYNKGAVVLHMLKGITGDSVFMNIMRSYINKPSLIYNTAVTEDFEAVADSVYGQNLGYFFNEWIYGVNYPKYNISWDYNLESGNIYKITLTINQTANTNPVFFTMPVQVKVSTILGDTLLTFFNNMQSQQFVFNVAGKPINLVFDPNNVILKTQTITDVPDDIIPKEFALKQNYPNPFNPSTKISYTIPIRSNVTLKVFDILGNEVAVIFSGIREAGFYTEEFKISNLIPSGIYFYSLSSGALNLTKKMTILK